MDLGKLLRLGDVAGGGGVLQGGDLIGVFGDARQHVGGGGDDHGEGGGELRQEGPHGGDDALINGKGLL